MKSAFLLFLFFISGCRFNHSPYSADFPDLKLNNSSMTRILSEEPSMPASFKIAFIADTHSYYTDTEKLIKKINSTGPYAFVIIAGDISDNGLVDEYNQARRIFNGLNFPYLVVVGNHDLLANGKSVYSKMFGSNDFSLSYKNLQVVFLNNNNWESTGAKPDADWVRNELRSSNTEFRILVGHVSPQDKARFSSAQQKTFEDIMTNEQVSFFFCGHDHNHGEEDFGSGKRITIGAPTKGFFSILTVAPGSISHQKASF